MDINMTIETSIISPFARGWFGPIRAKVGTACYDNRRPPRASSERALVTSQGATSDNHILFFQCQFDLISAVPAALMVLRCRVFGSDAELFGYVFDLLLTLRFYIYWISSDVDQTRRMCRPVILADCA